MSLEAAAALGEAERASLIAPPGHGKTWTLARAVAYAPAPQLVLTHTHAGIHALRRHLHNAGVPPWDYDIDTIAGFATRWAAAYPRTGGWDVNAAEPDLDELHPAATRVLARPQLLACVQRSYRGVLVDEYQDCTVDQHLLILALAEVLPARVVGDPLQAVYTFGNSPSVDFEADVYPPFPPLDPLTFPWRWADNQALAADLQRLREQLLAGEEPDWVDYPAISVCGDHPATLAAECARVADLGGSAVVLRKHPGQAHNTAKRLRGRFVSMEELAGRDVLAAAAALDNRSGPERAAAVIDVFEACTTKVASALKEYRQRYQDAEIPAVPRGKKAPLITALNAVASNDEPSTLCAAIEAARSYPDVVVYRPEILDNLAAGAQRCQFREESTSLVTEVGEVRDRERRTGRRLPNRVVSRTLLVKGLEFDHVIVCDLTDMDACHMYVALTRAGKSVSIIGG